MTGRILPDLTKTVVPFPDVAPAPKKRRGRPRRVTVEDVASRIRDGMSNAEIAKELRCSFSIVQQRRREAGLVRQRKQRRSPALRANKRFDAYEILDRAVAMPAVNNPALADQRTIYPTTVAPIAGLLNVLVEGANSRKIGSHIVKGKWKSFPIYTLTLEERATCPTTCAVWRSCYGNAMRWAKRLQHGRELEERLGHELAVLQSRHPKGFAVRLHVLGDFYSPEYVALWRTWLARFPALHVFGFSARHDDDDPIAIALKALVAERWPRFAVRFSNAPHPTRSTVTIEHPLQKPRDAVICPQQMGLTESCGTCALCWQSERRIAFIRH